MLLNSSLAVVELDRRGLDWIGLDLSSWGRNTSSADSTGRHAARIPIEASSNNTGSGCDAVDFLDRGMGRACPGLGIQCPQMPFAVDPLGGYANTGSESIPSRANTPAIVLFYAMIDRGWLRCYATVLHSLSSAPLVSIRTLTAEIISGVWNTSVIDALTVLWSIELWEEGSKECKLYAVIYILLTMYTSPAKGSLDGFPHHDETCRDPWRLNANPAANGDSR